MKKDIVKLAKIELGRNKKLVAKNTITEDERTVLTEHIRALEDLIKEAEASEEEITAEEIMRKMSESTDEKLRALEEKIENAAAAPNPGKAAENYLKTEEAKRDFGRIIRNCVNNRSDFNAEWYRHLQEGKHIENTISYSPDEISVLYPEVVRSKFHDLWNADTNWLTMLNNTRAKRFVVRLNKTNQDDAYVRAKGHKKGATKEEQKLAITSFTIDVQMVYKMVPIDRLTEFYDDGALVDYIIYELYRQMKYEIARCVLVGDGRNPGDPDEITSFTAITAATSDHVTTTSYDSNISLIENIMAMLNTIDTTDRTDLLLFIYKDDLTELRKRVYGAGGTVQYVSAEEVAAQLGVTRIITTPFFGAGETNRACAFIPSLYATVGDVENPRYEAFHEFKTNKDYHRLEAPVGGAPEGLLMGGLLAN